jgi:hypothetical protein
VADGLRERYVEGGVVWGEGYGAEPRVYEESHSCVGGRCEVRLGIVGYRGRVAVREGSGYEVKDVGDDGYLELFFPVSEGGTEVYLRLRNGTGETEFRRVYYPEERGSEITVLKPQEGDRLKGGIQELVEWDGGEPPYSVYYTCDNSGDYELVADGVNERDYLWLVPSGEHENCTIRVVDAEGNGGTSGVFGISEEVEESLTLISPNGG